MAIMPSLVWKFFEKSSDGSRAICTLCEKQLAYRNSTTSLKFHLSKVHGKDANTTDDSTERSRSGNESDDDDSRNNTSTESSFSEPFAPPSASTSGDAAGGSAQTSARRCKPRGPQFRDMPARNSRPITKERSERISQALADMTGMDMLPLSFCEHEGFHRFMEVVEPEYKIPSRNTVLRRIEKRANDLRQVMEEQLRKCSSIALTSDAWTSLSQESYLTVTAQFLDEDWESQRFTLSTGSLDCSHTGEEIANAIYDVTASYNIQGNIYGIVRDNASNMNKAASYLKSLYGIEGDVPCAAHTLQLCINTGLQSYQPLIKKASKMVGHFKHSTKASKALKLKQAQNNLPEETLIQSCPTRWNSTYHMFNRLLHQRTAIEGVLSDRTLTNNKDRLRLEISEDEWSTLEALAQTLKPLEMATTMLCSEKQSTLSIVRPLMDSLVNNHLVTTPRSPSASDDEGVAEGLQNFKKVISDDIVKRFELGRITTDDVLPSQVASLLDPRHASLDFESSDEVKNKVREYVREKMKDQQVPPEQTTDTTIDVEDPLTFLFKPSTIPSDELDAYLGNTPVPLHTNPLKWWRMNEAIYPGLAKVAKKYLGIPATSCSSERVFSSAGNIVTAKRSCLSPENVDMLVFVHQNRNLIK